MNRYIDLKTCIYISIHIMERVRERLCNPSGIVNFSCHVVYYYLKLSREASFMPVWLLICSGAFLFLCLSHPLQVLRISFWMAHYKSITPKRTKLWSSSPVIARFWKGGLRKAEMEILRAQNPTLPPCKQYTDSDGSKKFQGTASLKATQSWP